MKTKESIFYSWQSDLPNRVNRGFIEDCLARAVRDLRSDDSLQIDPVVDRDVQGSAGAVNIAETILAKIKKCAIFVADVSIINSHAVGRRTPNPNVMIELGYASNAIGFDRIVMVFNRAYGSPEELPFDLRFKKVLSYTLPEAEQDKTTARTPLVGQMKDDLTAILSAYQATQSANATGALSVVVGYEREKIEDRRHEYRLAITVQNVSNRKLDDYHIDIEVPAEVCIQPANRDSFVKGRSDRDIAFFRVTPQLLEGTLYPNDKRTIKNIFYFVDDKIWFDRQTVLEKTVKVTAYAEGMQPVTVATTLKKLQMF